MDGLESMGSGSWYGFAWEGKYAGLVLNGGRGCVAFTAGVVVARPWLIGGRAECC